MKLRYITNTLRINADFERAICSNGEKADAALTLCIAPAYESGAECPLAVAYIANNADPYPFAVQNDADEIFFGRDAFGSDSSDYAADGAFADWLTPKALRHAACDMRANDAHFLFQLADKLEGLAFEVRNPDDENDAIRAQVDSELPRPRGGFATATDEQDWKAQRDARFMELVNSRSQ